MWSSLWKLTNNFGLMKFLGPPFFLPLPRFHLSKNVLTCYWFISRDRQVCFLITRTSYIQTHFFRFNCAKKCNERLVRMRMKTKYLSFCTLQVNVVFKPKTRLKFLEFFAKQWRLCKIVLFCLSELSILYLHLPVCTCKCIRIHLVVQYSDNLSSEDEGFVV